VNTVLVTGATGFVGRMALAPLVAHGYDVHAVRFGPVVEAAGVTWHDTDLLDRPDELVARLAPSHLLHLAWYAVPGQYWTSRENLRWVRASLALYAAFVAAGGKRVVMAGSSAEYDWSAGTCREDATPIAPSTYYGNAKAALWSVVREDAKVAGVSAAWARFFFLYGPHEYPQRLVASVIRALLRGERAAASPGTQLRDFLHTADAAAATVALLDSPVTGPVNIASGQPIAVKELIERIRAHTGGEVDYGALPADPAPMIAADTHRLNDEVGWRPGVDHDARLRETIAWWRANS
jgi:nucleoside-diphosphate-sugar epimerase